MENLSIKAWAEAERPREKLMNVGRHTLTDSELIAILLRTGAKQITAVELARKLLAQCNNDLTEMSRLSVKELAKEKGMGEVKAITLVAALELGRRRREAEAMRKEKITTSQDAVNIMQPHLADLIHEEFWLLLLNRAHIVINKKKVSSGGVSGTVVDPKMVFKLAIENNACSIILCHNHPSGNNKPSDADISLTRKLKEAGNLLEITVIDHVIIAGASFYSFADEGMI